MTVYIGKRGRKDLAQNPAVQPKMRSMLKQLNADVSFTTVSTTTTSTTTTSTTTTT